MTAYHQPMGVVTVIMSTSLVTTHTGSALYRSPWVVLQSQAHIHFLVQSKAEAVFIELDLKYCNIPLNYVGLYL